MDKPDKPAHQSPKPARTYVTRQNYQSLVDQRFAQAQEDGLFDNLPGQGQPFQFDDDALVPEEYRAGFRLLKANGFAPPWIEARRDIEEERAKLAGWLAQGNQRWLGLDSAGRAALRAEYRRKLDDLQRMITNSNLTAPRGAAQVEGLRLPDELGKLGS
jgi:DnaJ family protein C protein 28